MIGCPAKPQNMLANHFSKYHPDIVGEERKRMLSGARRVAPDNVKKPFFKKGKA